MADPEDQTELRVARIGGSGWGRWASLAWLAVLAVVVGAAIAGRPSSTGLLSDPARAATSPVAAMAAVARPPTRSTAAIPPRLDREGPPWAWRLAPVVVRPTLGEDGLMGSLAVVLPPRRLQYWPVGRLGWQVNPSQL